MNPGGRRKNDHRFASQNAYLTNRDNGVLYEGRVNWVWRNGVITSRLIIEVTGNDARRLNHDLSVYFETWNKYKI